MISNGFLDPNQLGDIRQCSITDIGIYFTHLLHVRWLKQCYTNIIAFNITQFFPSLNHTFLSMCLRKAGCNSNIIGFFNSYHSNCLITYTQNSFSSPSISTNVGVDQGSVLSPIISTIYLVPIIKTFKKRIKSLKEKIPTNILSFVDNSLLISQEKSYDLSSSFLLCSYNIMSKILLDSGLVIEYSKSKVFYFMRFCHPPIPLLILHQLVAPFSHQN